MSTSAPDAIAGQPRVCGGVGAANVRSNQSRVAGEKASSGPIRQGYALTMVMEVDRLWFTDDPAACELLAKDPFALLVGFAIDQQVTVQKAFAGPKVLRERAGTLAPAALAERDLVPLFVEKPAIHRFPAAMAERVRDLASVVAEDYGGDASRIWREANDAGDLKKRLSALPGFGPMKVTALSAVLWKRFGVEQARELTPAHPTLGDVDSPEALERYQAAKREYKRTLRERARTS
jgi:uncharacterized HhH-GPD family protein